MPRLRWAPESARGASALSPPPPPKLKPELVTDAADHEILHDSHEYMFVDIPEEEEEKLAAAAPPPPRGGFFPW